MKMLFLGAGASQEIGPPTMQRLSQVLELEFENRGYGELISDIKGRLKNFGFKEDELEFETIFSILNGLKNSRESIKDMGPLAVYLSTFAKEMPIVKIPEDLREITENVVSRECIKYDEEMARKIYGPLLKVLNFRSSREVMLADSAKANEALCSSIATTNYDLVLEKIVPKLYGDRNRLTRGFNFETPYRGSFLHITSYRQSSVDYIKLHGSIDWFWREDINKIEELKWEPKEPSYYAEKYKGRMWIFPVQEKYVSKYPHSLLHGCFQRTLIESGTNVYIVIGYSFRDPAINNAFMNALTEKENSRIIIVNPKPDEVLDRITFPRASIIQRKIEDPKLPEELNEKLTST
jgi:hypothetical protein